MVKLWLKYLEGHRVGARRQQSAGEAPATSNALSSSTAGHESASQAPEVAWGQQILRRKPDGGRRQGEKTACSQPEKSWAEQAGLVCQQSCRPCRSTAEPPAAALHGSWLPWAHRWHRRAASAWTGRSPSSAPSETEEMNGFVSVRIEFFFTKKSYRIATTYMEIKKIKPERK